MEPKSPNPIEASGTNPFKQLWIFVKYILGAPWKGGGK